ncbi:hypothetical protein PR048_022044 [Dryococelus australis]|uniref:Uncharacterized protein n=1 Tax=Dryococelus australis TaxID=614101 RepID=A0ABQ9GZV6_9NEOP|nr:hypothetical protein PR048_022044 [Dryococelus australis]
MRVIEVSMARHRNEGAGEMGDPRENPLTNGIVRDDSHMRKSGVARPGIGFGSPWNEEVVCQDLHLETTHAFTRSDFTMSGKPKSGCPYRDCNSGPLQCQSSISPLRHLARYTKHGKFPKILEVHKQNNGAFGDAVARLLAFHRGEMSSIPGGITGTFACKKRGGHCRWSAGFLGRFPFSVPLRSVPAPSSPYFTLPSPRPLHSTLKLNVGLFFFTNVTQDIRNILNVQLFKTPSRVKRGRNGAASECKAGGKREICEKTRQPATSPGTIPTNENPGATRGLNPICLGGKLAL